MLVEFLQPWYGTPAGATMDISDNFAKYDLIPRKIAKAVGEPTTTTKEVKAAPKDKAVKGAAKTK